MTVEIDIEDYIDMLESRWNDVVGIWGGEEAEGLHNELMDLIRDSPPSPENANPSYIIDNYFINGYFYSKEAMIADNGLTDENEIDERWKELCEDALISNDKYLCRQF